MKKFILFIWMLLAAITLVSCTTDGEPIQVLGMEITSNENVHSLNVGETLQLNAKVYPKFIDQTVTWSTSDEYVAKVSANGLVTAIGGGNVEITATYVALNTVKQKYLITVEGAKYQPAPESISVSAKNNVTTCKVGETIRLTATVLPEEASQKVVWVSSDETIATVNRGIVKPLQEGQVEISVYPEGYENIVATIKLTFEKADEPTYSRDWANMEYTTHEEYMSCEDGTPIKVKGLVTHISPSKNSNVNYFVQNGSEGFYVYSQNNDTMPVEAGKVYEIGGLKKTYRGLSEITEVEYFKVIDEDIQCEPTNVNGLDVASQEVMGAYQCSYITGTAILKSVTTSTKSYNFLATVDGVEATFRVDTTYSEEEEFNAISSLLQLVSPGKEFEFTSVVIAYSTGEIIPQLLILEAKDLDFGEISTDDLLTSAAEKLDITTAVGFAVDTIELPTTIAGFDATVTWDSDNEQINPTTGAVTHTDTPATVTLVATIEINGKTLQKEFVVTVEAKDEKAYEVVATLDLEDALPANSWGNSETKVGYAEGIVELGTPKHKWMLRNALIAATTSDKYNGTFSIRAQMRDTASETGRIEIMEAGEYNVVEFAACIYGNDVLGAKVRIEYTFDDGATWTASDNIITLNNTTFETFRVKLPEGVKRVAIVLVEGVGRRVNFDDIKLMK